METTRTCSVGSLAIKDELLIQFEYKIVNWEGTQPSSCLRLKVLTHWATCQATQRRKKRKKKTAYKYTCFSPAKCYLYTTRITWMCVSYSPREKSSRLFLWCWRSKNKVDYIFNEDDRPGDGWIGNIVIEIGDGWVQQRHPGVQCLKFSQCFRTADRQLEQTAESTGSTLAKGGNKSSFDGTSLARQHHCDCLEVQLFVCSALDTLDSRGKK